MYERLYLFGSPVTCGYGGEIGVNKSVQVSVHDSVDVAGFKPSSGVLNQGIRHEDVGADLAAPFNLQLDAFSCICSYTSLARSIFIQLSLFWNWLRSVWQETTTPVGIWMRRTAEEVLLTCWPPAPLAR